MAIRSYNVSPYFDDYDPTKNYVQILAVAGKAEQSREFSQVSTMYRDFLGRLGDAVFKNGAIIEGCDIVIGEGDVTVTKGKLYLDGLVRNILEDAVIPITGVGTELIGVKIVETVVTANQDASLRNPAVGTEAYGLEGAHRVKQEIVFTVNDPDATTLFKLVDGELEAEIVYEETPFDIISDVIARRTYDENGNFKIRGMDMFQIPTQTQLDIDENKIKVGISEGKAYIQGYEVVKPYQTSFRINKSIDFESVQDESSVYESGRTDYMLNNYPVKQVTRVNIVVEVTESVTRGTTQDGRDELAHRPVKDILEVKQGDTIYNRNADWQKIGNYIDWNIPQGREPESGSTYTVKYRYTYTMQASEFSVVEKDINGEKFHFLRLTSTTHIPVVDSDIDVDYDYYLARKDLVLMDRNGEVTVLEGVPAKANKANTPINSDVTLLIIGSVLAMPNSSDVYLVNEYTTRLTQAELYNLKRRIDDLEVSIAMTDLDREAIEGEDATDLKGIYTDGFIGFTKADVDNPEFDCSIDIDMAEMTLPMENDGVVELTPDMNSEDTNCSVLGRVLTAPYTEVLVAKQLKASQTMLINPYAVYEPQCPIKLNPEVDNWIETTKITINKKDTKSYTLRRWWYHRGASWAESEKAKWKQLGFADGGKSLGWGKGETTVTSTSSKVVSDEVITYMRQREVQVYASNLVPGLDNIECYFNGIKVPLTSRISSTYKPCKDSSYTGIGTQEGTCKACPHGHIWAKFTIPNNQPCGSAKVEIVGANCRGEAVYQAQGRKQTVETTVLTTKVVVKPKDPLAQSFQFATDTVLTSVDLYFAAKDSTKPCVIQVRNMVNGYPGTECYAEEILDVDNIRVSADATDRTNVKFSQPVYCHANEQYCIAVLTDSNVYQLWVAELGKQDITGGGSSYITSQPYVEGVLFSSSNALTWTAHQTMDLKFALYKAHYNGRGSIRFNNITAEQMNRVVLAAQVIDYKNAGIEWWYRASSNEDWELLDTYIATDLSSIKTTFQLKAILNVAYSTSPIMATDCINLIYFLEGTTATYVSRMIETEEEFTNLKVMLQVALPAGTSVNVYYKCESDETPVWTELTNKTISRVSSEWQQYIYTKTGISATKYRVKIVLHSDSPLVRPRARKLINILKY